jgi:hypothetical protein
VIPQVASTLENPHFRRRNSCIHASDCYAKEMQLDAIRDVVFVGRLVKEKARTTAKSFLRAKEQQQIPSEVRLIFGGRGPQSPITLPVQYALILRDGKGTQKIWVLQHWELREIINGKTRIGYTEIEELRQEMGVSYISMAPWFQQATYPGESVLYYDNIHVNNDGQKLMAEVIYEIIYSDTSTPSIPSAHGVPIWMNSCIHLSSRDETESARIQLYNQRSCSVLFAPPLGAVTMYNNLPCHHFLMHHPTI